MWKQIGVILVVLLLASCSQANESNNREVEITISAAASLKDALMELKREIEQENPSVTIYYNFGATGTLKQQITQGAPVDLFFSASKEKFELLVEEGYIEESVHLLGNEVVLITHNTFQKATSFFNLTNDQIKTIAIGSPDVVPAGEYGKQTLLSIQEWDKIESKLIPTKDVRQVLSYVETGNVDVGIVYQSDATISNSVKVVDIAPKGSHTDIIYPLGIVKGYKSEEVRKVYESFQQEEAMRVFEKYGFQSLK